MVETDLCNYLLRADNLFENSASIQVESNSYAVSSALNEDELYFWKVIAVDEGGDETSSETWSFWTNSTNSAPEAFTLLSPEQDEETGLRPTFTFPLNFEIVFNEDWLEKVTVLFLQSPFNIFIAGLPINCAVNKVFGLV